MELSVIIVNFRVKLFLEQCLFSLEKALQHFTAEIIVVDNSPEEHTKSFLQQRFPNVTVIECSDNPGFAKACNRGLTAANGKNILFLNPDTLLPGDIFEKTLPFLNGDPNIGSLGVKMLDGAGKFLPESKRGFPTIGVSFCKLAGLHRIFPRSKYFSRYYLGHLSPNRASPVDILSGAFMLIKKEVLDKTGGFDERFFMYAEDIDLSYRITTLGYLNYYYPDTPILHFKGESSSRNREYYTRFYTAMQQFVQKYSGNNLHSRLLSLGIAFWERLAFLSASPKTTTSAQPLNLRFSGDPLSRHRAAEILEQAGISIHPNPAAPETEVCCEGPAFSFKDIISHMERNPGRNYLIHAAESTSVVGSPDSSLQGWAIGGKEPHETRV